MKYDSQTRMSAFWSHPQFCFLVQHQVCGISSCLKPKLGLPVQRTAKGNASAQQHITVYSMIRTYSRLVAATIHFCLSSPQSIQLELSTREEPHTARSIRRVNRSPLSKLRDRHRRNANNPTSCSARNIESQKDHLHLPSVLAFEQVGQILRTFLQTLLDMESPIELPFCQPFS